MSMPYSELNQTMHVHMPDNLHAGVYPRNKTIRESRS